MWGLSRKVSAAAPCPPSLYWCAARGWIQAFSITAFPIAGYRFSGAGEHRGCRAHAVADREAGGTGIVLPPDVTDGAGFDLGLCMAAPLRRGNLARGAAAADRCCCDRGDSDQAMWCD